MQHGTCNAAGDAGAASIRSTVPASTSSHLSGASAESTCKALVAQKEDAPWPGWQISCVIAPRRRANDKPRRADKEYIKEYITPSLNLRFRSHKAAVEFISIINMEEGNEESAWERYQVLKG
jgi:hypothetical protein